MKNLTDSATYTANVRCPEDGDAVDGSAIEAGLQDLANRSAFLKEKVHADTPITFKRIVPPTCAADADNAGENWKFNSLAPYWSILSPSGERELVWTFKVPHGATVTAVRAAVHQEDAGASFELTAFLELATPGMDPPASVGTTQLGSNAVAAGLGAQLLEIDGFSHVFDAENTFLALTIVSSDGGGFNMVHGVEVEFTHTNPMAGLAGL